MPTAHGHAAFLATKEKEIQMELSTLILVAVIGLASYRVTRFLLFDTLIEGTRNHWYTFASNRRRPALLWNKLLDLTTCTWCSGVWISAGLYLGWINYDWTHTPIIIAAIAGLQGLLHAYEPGDE